MVYVRILTVGRTWQLEYGWQLEHGWKLEHGTLIHNE